MKKARNNPENLKKLAREWFLKAEEDGLSAGGILKDKDGAPSTVCFLSQQVAEKYLKGYLTSKGQGFPKVHDLASLLKLCEKKDMEFAKLSSDTLYLRPFYIATRYPGDYPTFSFKEAEQAFKRAIKIKEFVLEKVFKI